MRRALALPILLALGAAQAQECVLPASPPPDQSRVVFILDTSGSMQGLGDGRANIFAKVQGSMLRGMRATQVPGSVELLTFDKGPRKRASFAWPQEQAAFEQNVNELQADGSNTWLYASMQAMFSSLKTDPRSATTVYLITDGIDNNPDKTANISTALNEFNLSRGPFDKLYYVALGVQIPQGVKDAFRATTFAQAIELPLNQAPEFSNVALAPGMVTVGSDGSFPYTRPGGTSLSLESPSIGGAQVEIKNPEGAGERVNLSIQGSVPAGSMGYMCAKLPSGQQNVLLRFQRDTPPLRGEAPVPVDVLGTLVLLNPEVNRTLKRGQSAVLRYKAVNGPVTVEVHQTPAELDAKLPDQVISLLEGQQVNLTVTDKALAHDQEAAPLLRLNDTQPFPVPPFKGIVLPPFAWQWYLPLFLPLLLLIWWRRETLPFTPYALSVDRALRVTLHDRDGQRRSRLLRRDLSDIGKLFKVPRLHGLNLQRFRPELGEEEVLLDNTSVQSMRAYAAQQMRRAAKLNEQPERLRLYKKGEAEGTFLQLEETLALQQLYVFTDYEPPKQRVRPPAPPPEPPIEVIVTLLDGQAMQDLELPLEDVDLADVFGNPNLRGLTVRREPGVLRLRALPAGMRLMHISRHFEPGDALPLAVMLDLTTPTGPYQVRIRDKASVDRLRR